MFWNSVRYTVTAQHPLLWSVTFLKSSVSFSSISMTHTFTRACVLFLVILQLLINKTGGSSLAQHIFADVSTNTDAHLDRHTQGRPGRPRPLLLTCHRSFKLLLKAQWAPAPFATADGMHHHRASPPASGRDTAKTRAPQTAAWHIGIRGERGEEGREGKQWGGVLLLGGDCRSTS